MENSEAAKGRSGNSLGLGLGYAIVGLDGDATMTIGNVERISSSGGNHCHSMSSRVEENREFMEDDDPDIRLGRVENRRISRTGGRTILSR